MRIKWQYETREDFEEAKKVAEKFVAGSEREYEEEALRICFANWQAEEKFTIAYQNRDKNV
jgi:hypothetical protein